MAKFVFAYVTLLQLLVFLNLQLIFSHFDGVFSLFMGNEQVFGAYFDNFLPLSPRKSGVHTFLQKSHTYINMGMYPEAKGRSREVWDGLPGME